MDTTPNRPINRRPLLLLAALIALQLYAPSKAPAESVADLRRQMVQYQLKGRDIVDARVLKAMSIVPRHRFVPEKLQTMAYQDNPLPIGHGQTISQPYIVALMSQLLAIRPGQRILEIGTGSGYQAAVLAEMDASVYSIEIVPELGRQARKVLDSLGYETVRLKIGDGYRGWPQYAPFDGIIVTCAPTRIPEPLKAQLAEGGHMVIPFGPRHRQQLALLTKEGGKIRQEKVVDVRFVPMVDGSGRIY